jgi:TonB family protein
MAGAYADGVVYGVYTYDNPEPRDSFDDFIARQAPRGGWDDSSVRSVKLGRYTGKEYSSNQSENPWTVQLFAVENRFYKFGATGAPSDDAAVKQFFSSITLDGKGGIEVSDGPGGSFSPPHPQVVSSAVGIGGGSGSGTATGPDLYSRIFTGREVDRKPRLVMKPEPSYTEYARQAGTVGTVVLKVVFSSNGSVTNIRVFQELPHGLTEQAIAAARKIKYIPSMKDGRYVSMWMQLEYNFNLY